MRASKANRGATQREHSLWLPKFSVDPAKGGERVARLGFLRHGPIHITLSHSLTFLIGENGSGKTTLLEALAAKCAIRPLGGRSYQQWEDREATAISEAVAVPKIAGRRGLFLRADRFAETMREAGQIPMAMTGEWRDAMEQSRGEGVLSLLSMQVDASEAMLYFLDEPETGLSPHRQLALLCVLDAIVKDGRSQAIVATHSPILMSHPNSDRFWMDQDGLYRRDLVNIPHWREMSRFMRDPDTRLSQLLE